jgi:tRNA(Ile)-lysidine synthase TilS/MesJ
MDDLNDPDIIFDINGQCNYCTEFDEKKFSFIFDTQDEQKNLENIKNQVQRDYSNKKYDAILGLSGGVDSSYVAYLAHKMDLKVLLVQLDN